MIDTGLPGPMASLPGARGCWYVQCTLLVALQGLQKIARALSVKETVKL